MNPWIQVALLALLPISELRGAIPLGFAQSLPIILVFAFAVVFNILVIPLVYLFLETLHKFLYKIPFYKRFFDYMVARTQKKMQKFRKYEYWGLFFFVAIPLPITGAYTGTLAAWLIGLEKRKAFIPLALGVIVAGIIVTLVLYLGLETFQLFVK